MIPAIFMPFAVAATDIGNRLRLVILLWRLVINLLYRLRRIIIGLRLRLRLRLVIRLRRWLRVREERSDYHRTDNPDCDGSAVSAEVIAMIAGKCRSGCRRCENAGDNQ